jgi:hypothetical protein
VVKKLANAHLLCCGDVPRRGAESKSSANLAVGGVRATSDTIWSSDCGYIDVLHKFFHFFTSPDVFALRSQQDAQ